MNINLKCSVSESKLSANIWSCENIWYNSDHMCIEAIIMKSCYTVGLGGHLANSCCGFVPYKTIICVKLISLGLGVFVPC